MRYMASSQVLSGRCVPWSGVPEVTLNRYRQPRQLNRLGRVDSRRTSSLEHRGQRTPSGQRAASSQARHSASERNLSSRPGSVQSFMIIIYRTAPAYQNRVQQGNNSAPLYYWDEQTAHCRRTETRETAPTILCQSSLAVQRHAGVVRWESPVERTGRDGSGAPAVA